MDSYGDGNVYRGQVCKDSEIKTIEINKYNADVERLVEAASKLANECEAEFTLDGYWNNDGALVTRKTVTKLKAALEPFNK